MLEKEKQRNIKKEMEGSNQLMKEFIKEKQAEQANDLMVKKVKMKKKKKKGKKAADKKTKKKKKKKKQVGLGTEENKEDGSDK